MAETVAAERGLAGELLARGLGGIRECLDFLDWARDEAGRPGDLLDPAGLEVLLAGWREARGLPEELAS